MYATSARNKMLDALNFGTASLHSAFSTTGANEISGGSPAYARKAISVNAASSGSRSLFSAVTFDVPGGVAIRWVGYWSSDTTPQFLGMTPNGGTPREFTADLAANVIQAKAHGYPNGEKVVFFGGTPPGGLAAGTIYYVVNAATDSFQVAATVGGAAIDLTAEPGADCVVSKIVEETPSSQATFTLNSMTWDLGF